MANKEKLLDQAKEHLNSGEEVVCSIRGQYETKLLGNNHIRTGIFMATDRRLVFYAKKFGGFDLESFPYSNISSFEQSKNFMGASFSFFASGNKVSMKWISEADLPQFAETVRQRMGKDVSQSPAPATLPTPAAVSGDIPDQLRKLGELHQAGVLTEEEFTAKKADLLARM